MQILLYTLDFDSMPLSTTAVVASDCLLGVGRKTDWWKRFLEVTKRALEGADRALQEGGRPGGTSWDTSVQYMH